MKICVCVSSIRCLLEKEMKREKEKEMKRENENKNEEHYFKLLVFPAENVENIEIPLELLDALAGLEITGSRLACRLACDSFETGFVDGTLLSFLEPEDPCSFGAS